MSSVARLAGSYGREAAELIGHFGISNRNKHVRPRQSGISDG
jgi:hypothetical protein